MWGAEGLGLEWAAEVRVTARDLFCWLAGSILLVGGKLGMGGAILKSSKGLEKM